MSDVAGAAAPAVTEQPVAGNDPAARTETGELKDNLSAKPTEPEKTAEATGATEEKKPEAKAEPGKVPETYDFKLPEGLKLDDKVAGELTPLFKELGLTQDQAQKLIDFQAKHEAATEKTVADMRAEWRNEVVKAPDLGNGTDNLKPEVRANLSKVMDAVGDSKAVAAFKSALDLTGVGDNPAVIRGLNAIGKLLSEGTLVRGGSPSPAGQTAPGATQKLSPAQRMFPNLPSSSTARA